MLKHYESIRALREDYIRLDGSSTGGYGGYSWYGGESAADTLRLSATGDTKLVPDAERMFSSLDLGIETPRRTWERSPSGPFCAVPDVLAGLPTPMRRQVHTLDERAPITILVTTTSSAGIDAKVLTRRGTTILALTMALSRVRPISLRQLTLLDGTRDGSGETVITAEINTTPLDLATACYVLTSSGFARRMTYTLAEKLNLSRGRWPRNFNYTCPQPYYAALVPRLGLNPAHTLVIEAARLNDALLSDPIAWINTQIERFTATQAEETL